MHGIRQRDDCATDTSNEAVHDRPKERVVAVSPTGYTQAKPCKDLVFANIAANGIVQERWQICQSTGPNQEMRKVIDKVIAG